MGKKPCGKLPVPLPCTGKLCPCTGEGFNKWGWGGSCNTDVTFGAVFWLQGGAGFGLDPTSSGAEELWAQPAARASSDQRGERRDIAGNVFFSI